MGFLHSHKQKQTTANQSHKAAFFFYKTGLCTDNHLIPIEQLYF